MKTPKSLEPLIEDGLVDEVLRSLKSGKEATVYVVSSNGEIRCAKVYKEVEKRSFRSQTKYQEGRSERNSRRSRAMGKGSAYGRQEQESAWQNAEVDALYRLADAGVRVPQPYGVFDGVLLMELVTNADGSIDMYLQAESPGKDKESNWLPAPKGKFVLMFRAYLPGAPLLDGSLRLPPVTEGEMIP